MKKIIKKINDLCGYSENVNSNETILDEIIELTGIAIIIIFMI